MQKYVLGFLFSEDESEVLLLRKQQPRIKKYKPNQNHWQNGKINGIGGHIEPNEVALYAMEREFKEEVNIDLFPTWDIFASMGSDDWRVYCYRATTPFNMNFYASLPETNDVGEILEIHDVERVTSEVDTFIPNLPWLIAMAKKTCSHEWPYLVEVGK